MLWSDEVSVDTEPRGGWYYTAYLNGLEIFKAWYPSTIDEGAVLLKGRDFFAHQLKKGLSLT